MAKENTVIGDIVKKSKVLLLDIEGTTTSISFVKVGLMNSRPVFYFNACFLFNLRIYFDINCIICIGTFINL